MYIQYNPQKHKGKKLYEVRTTKIDDCYVTAVHPSSTTHVVATQIPWYFVVRSLDSGLKGL